MKYPKTVDELIHWDTFTQRDSFGSFTVITGFEGTGHCFWCGDEIQGRRRYCGGNKGCWTQYYKHFGRTYAANAARKRALFSCENCGVQGIDIPPIGRYERSGLEVHHIIPINGEDRTVHVYNIFWNLICLCHDCHMELHAIMRPPKIDKPIAIDSWEEAVKVRQSIFSFGAMK